MSRNGRLVGLVGGLSVIFGGALQVAAGPVKAVVPDRAQLVRSVATGPGAPAVRPSRPLFGLLERGPGGAIILPVGTQMSFGFGYEYLTEEDLVFEVAETGSLAGDYDSHRVMVRAKWRF